MQPNRIILAAILSLSAIFACILLTGCVANASALTRIASTYGIAKLVQNSSTDAKPGRVAGLRKLADGLDLLAQGSVSRAKVQSLIAGQFKDEPEAQAAVTAIILTYFPADPVPVHHDENLAAIARALASAIRDSLPPIPAK